MLGFDDVDQLWCSQEHDKWHQSQLEPREWLQDVAISIYSEYERTISVKVTEVRFPITKDVVHQVFGNFGIEDTVILPKGGDFEALIRFKLPFSAKLAKCYDERYVYDGGELLTIEYSSQYVLNKILVSKNRPEMMSLVGKMVNGMISDAMLGLNPIVELSKEKIENVVGNELVSFESSLSDTNAVSNNGIGNETGVVGVKEVDWSVFHADSEQAAGNGFGSSSDIFGGVDDAKDGDPFENLVGDSSGNGTRVTGAVVENSTDYVTDNFSQHKILGNGGFGTVYKGELQDGTKIAVKRMESSLMSEKGLDEFKSKIAVLTKVRHRHLVALLGYCLDGNERILVYEYMPKGTLSRFLFDWKEERLKPLEWMQRLIPALKEVGLTCFRDMVYQVIKSNAKDAVIALIDQERGGEQIDRALLKSVFDIFVEIGMRNMDCYENDFEAYFLIDTSEYYSRKAPNVFINSQRYGCISDLGLANIIATTFLPSALCYAPEVKNTKHVSQASDVYSFGILLLELLTRKSPVHIPGGPKAVDLVKLVTSVKSKEWAVKVFDADLLKNPHIKDHMINLLQIGIRCVAKSPTIRPKMFEVVKMIEEISNMSSQTPATLEMKLVLFQENDPFDLEDMLRASAGDLGKGTYGTCYKASLENGTTVAVKRLKDVRVSSIEFQTQMEVIGRNVLELKAYYYSRDEILLVYDGNKQGRLSTLLHGSKGDKRAFLDWNARLKIATGAARGIAHIHKQDGGSFVHGNIKSSNIFLNEQQYGPFATYYRTSEYIGFRSWCSQEDVAFLYSSMLCPVLVIPMSLAKQELFHVMRRMDFLQECILEDKDLLKGGGMSCAGGVYANKIRMMS